MESARGNWLREFIRYWEERAGTSAAAIAEDMGRAGAWAGRPLANAPPDGTRTISRLDGLENLVTAPVFDVLFSDRHFIAVQWEAVHFRFRPGAVLTLPANPAAFGNDRAAAHTKFHKITSLPIIIPKIQMYSYHFIIMPQIRMYSYHSLSKDDLTGLQLLWKGSKAPFP